MKAVVVHEPGNVRVEEVPAQKMYSSTWGPVESAGPISTSSMGSFHQLSTRSSSGTSSVEL
jgi:hypothetical protein